MRRREFTIYWGTAVLCGFLASEARAQAKSSRVAFLTLEPGEDASRLLMPLRDLGYVEGVNLSFAYRSAEGDPTRLRKLADELVRSEPDVLVAGFGTLTAKAAKEATATTPIVFTTVGDPVGASIVQSLARPEANVTGFSGQAAELKGKQLQLLKEIAPGQQVIGVLLNPDTPYTPLALRQLQAAADADGTRLEVLVARTPGDFSSAKMKTLVAAGATSLFVFEDPLTIVIRDKVVEMATRLGLPTMAGQTDYVVAGALISYGTDREHYYRRAADYVDKILKGAHPGDLPVEQPTKFELAINLKTAKALGLTVPPAILAAADEVIE
jgi:putative ABC transport system substrate-binding protein